MAIGKVSHYDQFNFGYGKNNFQYGSNNEQGKKLSDFYIYDKFGNFVGIDYSKMNSDNSSVADVQDVVMEALKQKEDNFVKQAQEEKINEEEEAKQAKKDKKTIADGHNNFDKLVGSIEKYTADKNTEVADMVSLAKKLTSTEISNTTVIESTKDFQSKLKKLEEEVKMYKEIAKANEKEGAFSVETQRDIYEKNNKVQAHEVGADIEKYFSNNPFYNSASKVVENDDEKLEMIA